MATAAAALGFVLAARLLAGESQQAAAVLGASIAGFTAIVSLLGLGWALRTPHATRSALLVLAAVFGARILLVGAGTLLVGRAGAVGYVAGFFVPYFVLAALEGAYVHSLRRSGDPA